MRERGFKWRYTDLSFFNQFSSAVKVNHTDALRVKDVQTSTIAQSTNRFTMRKTYALVTTNSRNQSGWIKQKNSACVKNR